MAARNQSKQLDVPHVDSALVSILVPRVVGYLRDCAHFPSTHLSRSSTSADTGGGCCSRSRWQWLFSNLDLDDADMNSLVHLSLTALMAMVTIGRGVGTPAMNALGLSMKHHADQQNHRQQQTSTQALSTRRTANNHNGGTGVGSSLDRLRRVSVYIILSGLLPAAHRMLRKRWEEEEEDAEDGGEHMPPLASQQMERIATSRRRKVRDGVMKFIAYVVPPARLLNHLIFILRGGGTTGNDMSAPPPTLPMRLAGLSYGDEDGGDQQQTAQAVAQQHINYAYAYRRALYEQAFSLAVMMSPIARQLAAVPRSAMESVAQYKERMQHFFHTLLDNKTRRSAGDDDRYLTSKAGANGGHKCKICHADPVIIPYMCASASDGKEVYCYYCVRLALLDKPMMQKSRVFCRQQNLDPILPVE